MSRSLSIQQSINGDNYEYVISLASKRLLMENRKSSIKPPGGLFSFQPSRGGLLEKGAY